MSTRSTTFSSGIYALLAEGFDDREKLDLTERFQTVLETCFELLEGWGGGSQSYNYNYSAYKRSVSPGGRYQHEISLLCSLLYYSLNLRNCSGKESMHPERKKED